MFYIPCTWGKNIKGIYITLKACSISNVSQLINFVYKHFICQQEVTLVVTVICQQEVTLVVTAICQQEVTLVVTVICQQEVTLVVTAVCQQEVTLVVTVICQQEITATSYRWCTNQSDAICGASCCRMAATVKTWSQDKVCSTFQFWWTKLVPPPPIKINCHFTPVY